MMRPRWDESLCGCCGGTSARTPQAIHTLPGGTAVDVRSGEYRDFLDTMLARLTSKDSPALSALRSRDGGNDFSIALLDAWAVVAHVLEFYSERLLSETLLKSADEIWSLHQLAGLVGYQPGPGVAASAELAFTLSEAPGSPRSVKLPSGLKVQSTPGPDQVPATYETTRPVEARPAWNAMQLRQTSLQSLTVDTTELFLDASSPNVSPGNGIFFFTDDASPVFAIIREVHGGVSVANTDAHNTLTRLTIEPFSAGDDREYELEQQVVAPASAALPNYPELVGEHMGRVVSDVDLEEIVGAGRLTEDFLFDTLAFAPETSKRVLIFRQVTGVFGSHAPSFESLPPSMTTDSNAPYKGHEKKWADASLETLASEDVFAPKQILLDRVVPDVARNSYICLRQGSAYGIFQIASTREASVSKFAVTARATVLGLTTAAGFDKLNARDPTAFLQSEWVDLPRRPRTDALRTGTSQIELDTWAPGLRRGQRLALRGIRADGLAARVTSIVEVDNVQHRLDPGGSTTISVKQGLSDDFDRTALRINANMATATHGESTSEILGSGDPTRPFMQLEAKQKPLTYITSSAPDGALEQAELRVDGILWKRADSLVDAAPNERVYTLKTDEEGRASFGFGDGVTGAMPTPGRDNVTLKYRTGLGIAGRVAAGQLNMLMTRPLGVQEVTNPLPSDGGADPEPPEALRETIPLSCRTLGRIVSLTDFADFARSFSGIAKAHAEWASFTGAQERGVLLTVAGEEGEAVTGKLYDKLRDAVRDNGVPFASWKLKSFESRFFRLAAKVRLLPDVPREDVLLRIEEALKLDYSFEARPFRAPVFASGVVSTIQRVKGVDAVVLDRLYAETAEVEVELADEELSIRKDVLTTAAATSASGAELLMLHPDPLDYLTVIP